MLEANREFNKWFAGLIMRTLPDELRNGNTNQEDDKDSEVMILVDDENSNNNAKNVKSLDKNKK